MIQSLYTAATGLSAEQARLDTIANNISNVSTTGYKSAEVSFKDALYGAMEDPAQPGDTGNLQKGRGVVLNATTRDESAGNLNKTERELDFAVEGEGYFCLQNASGDRFYTRNGSFALSSEGGRSYLVSAGGKYVLNENGNRILLPPGSSAVAVSADGVITANGGTPAGVLGVFSFRNQRGLAAAGESMFAETTASGAAVRANDCTVVQGTLEGSNVNLAGEMSALIRAQRSFSLASRALQTADEMEGLANNIRR